MLTDPLTPLIDYDTAESNFVLEYLRGAGLPKEYGHITVIPADGPLGDLNSNGLLDLEDIDLLSERVRQSSEHNHYDLNDDGIVDAADHRTWVKDLKHTRFGDADLNGEFNSRDMVQVFAAGKYETAERVSWSEGDWNGDDIFDSSDMVTAFADDGYEQGPLADAVAVPEPTSALLLVTGLVGVAIFRRRVRSWTATKSFTRTLHEAPRQTTLKETDRQGRKHASDGWFAGLCGAATRGRSITHRIEVDETHRKLDLF